MKFLKGFAVFFLIGLAFTFNAYAGVHFFEDGASEGVHAEVNLSTGVGGAQVGGKYEITVDPTVALGDFTLTDGRFVVGTEAGGTCSTGLVIDLAVAAKGILTTIGETNTACAISFTNGLAGEQVILSHNYTGSGIVTFADVTGFDASWTPVGATCSGIDAGVTAANNDHFYLQGAMTSATEILITGCQYFNAA